MSDAPRAMPVTCLVLSALLVALYLAGHAAGLREHVGILSGTMPGTNGEGAAGALYVLSWFAALLVAPTLALAAVFRVAGHYLAVLLRRRRAPAAARARASAVAARQP